MTLWLSMSSVADSLPVLRFGLLASADQRAAKTSADFFLRQNCFHFRDNGSSLNKIKQLNWMQVYRDNGLKWEKIVIVRAPTGVDVIYSLRITQARSATAFRDGQYMRILTIASDHDSTYGKK